jgi:hypothetical protein
MFDHFHPNAIQLERRSSWLINPKGSRGWNADRRPNIVPNKSDASLVGRGPEFNAYVSPAEIPEAGYRNRSGKRALAARN